MPVFIRSQDRESLVMINSTIYLVPHLDGERVRIACGSDDLGDYESKERAIEVLDLIQENNCYIYDMPKE